jgi:hypothetical protein
MLSVLKPFRADPNRFQESIDRGGIKADGLPDLHGRDLPLSDQSIHGQGRDGQPVGQRPNGIELIDLHTRTSLHCQDCLIDVRFPKTQILNRRVDIPMPQRPLRSEDIMPQVVVHPVRECLPHGVSCDLAGQMMGVDDLLEDPVILDAADRQVALPASEYKLIGGEGPLLVRPVLDPRSQRGLCLGMKFHGPAFELAFAVSAAIRDGIRDPSALDDVP